jgi:CO dehydrogenase maturation factor
MIYSTSAPGIAAMLSNTGASPMNLRIAIAGKGGVGKTALSAALCRALVARSRRVLAVDADPNNCLGRALGIPERLLAEVTPLSEMTELLTERAGTASGGGFFALNPQVDDLLGRFKVEHEGLSLLVMGTVDEPGAGCVCPESAVLKALVRHLVSLDEYSLLMDMEAGLEHLGRGTAAHVGALLIVVEPAPSSARAATRIAKLAKGLRLRVPGVVLNKVKGPEAKEKVLPYLNGLEVVAELPADPAVAESEAVPTSGPFVAAVEDLLARLSHSLSVEAGDDG